MNDLSLTVSGVFSDSEKIHTIGSSAKNTTIEIATVHFR